MSLLSPQLDAFLAIVKHKTVHAAADTLFVTQTAVTQRIRGLESKLGTTLFIRSRRGMLLTPEGEALLRYCQAVQELEGEALANIKGAAKETSIQLTLTGPTSIMQSRVISQVLPVMRQFGNLLLHFDINDGDDRQQSLRSGDSQLAILSKEEVMQSMDSKLLEPEHYVLVCTHKWRKRRLKDIIREERIIDFNPSDKMTLNYLTQYHLVEHVRNERHFANHTESLALLLADGLGYSVLSTEFSKHLVKEKQLMILNEGKTYEHILALAWFNRPELPSYLSALIEAIK